MDYIRWIMFGLGILIGVGLALLSYSTGTGPPACGGLGDCILEAQALLAGLLAVGAAWIAYRGVIRQIAAADLREERIHRRDLKELALTLAGTFEGLRYQIETLRQRVERYRAPQGRPGTPTVAKVGIELRVWIPPVIDRLEVNVGALGHKVAEAVAKTRFALERLSWMSRDWPEGPNANEPIQGEDLDKVVELLAGIESVCTDLPSVLRDISDAIENLG